MVNDLSLVNIYLAALDRAADRASYCQLEWRAATEPAQKEILLSRFEDACREECQCAKKYAEALELARHG